MKKGLLIVFSGPSGVGKGTLLKELMPMKELKLMYSVSMTTRKPREGEVDGVNYFFVTKRAFNKAVKEGKLLEHVEYVGNYYGTPKDYVNKKRKEGFNVILEIEVQGAKKIIESGEDCLSIFITPPSIKELENRIRGRKSESEEVIKERIKTAKKELKNLDLYDYTVCNDKVDQAVKDVRKIILKEMKVSMLF